MCSCNCLTPSAALQSSNDRNFVPPRGPCYTATQRLAVASRILRIIVWVTCVVTCIKPMSICHLRPMQYEYVPESWDVASWRDLRAQD